MSELDDLLGPMPEQQQMPSMADQARANWFDAQKLREDETARQARRQPLSESRRSEILIKYGPQYGQEVIRKAEGGDLDPESLQEALRAGNSTSRRETARVRNEGRRIRRAMAEQVTRGQLDDGEPVVYQDRNLVYDKGGDRWVDAITGDEAFPGSNPSVRAAHHRQFQERLRQASDRELVQYQEGLQQRRVESGRMAEAYANRPPEWKEILPGVEADLNSYNPATNDFGVTVDKRGMLPDEIKQIVRPDGVYEVRTTARGKTKYEKVDRIPPTVEPKTMEVQGKDGPETMLYYVDGKQVVKIDNFKSPDKETRPFQVRDSKGRVRLIDPRTGKSIMATDENGDPIIAKNDRMPMVSPSQLKVQVGTISDNAYSAKPRYEPMFLSQITEFDDDGKPTRSYAIANEESIKRLEGFAAQAEKDGNTEQAQEIRDTIRAYSPSAPAEPAPDPAVELAKQEAEKADAEAESHAETLRSLDWNTLKSLVKPGGKISPAVRAEIVRRRDALKAEQDAKEAEKAAKKGTNGQ